MNPIRPQNVPAIVVGGGVNALGVVRSLGSMDLPLIVIDTNPKSPAMRSKYGKKLVVPSLEGQELIDNLLELAGKFSEPLLLFATEEKTVRTVSEYRIQLAPAFTIRLPEHGRLMQLMHKQGFQDLAESFGAPIPKTVRLQSTTDLAQVERLTFPCVLKPSEKNYEYGARFKKAYKVASSYEVEKLYNEISPVMPDLVVQEWIEGDDSDIYFCLQYLGKDFEIVASFPGRKIRSWPPRIGGTASCTSAWEHEEQLTKMTKDFFQLVGFTGMGSMEYKRDSRDGNFYMIEPTVARTDFQQEVATVNGVNMPLAAYLYERGLPSFTVERPIKPVVWRDPQSDRWAFEEGGRVTDTRSAAYDICNSYFRWSDPMPWVDDFRVRLKLRLARLLNSNAL